MLVVTVGEDDGDGYEVHAYTPGGALTWRYAHGAVVTCVTIGISDTVYIGGGTYSGYEIEKLDRYGTMQLQLVHGATVYCIATDTLGNIYVGGGVAGDSKTTRKYDHEGTLVWSANHGDDVRGIAIDSEGNVYTTGIRNDNINATFSTIRKYDSNGTLLWSGDHKSYSSFEQDANGYCVAIGPSGYVYEGGDRVQGNEESWAVVKYDPDTGAEEDRLDGNGIVNGIALRTIPAIP